LGVARETSKDKNMFQDQKPQVSMRWPEVKSELENKRSNSPIYNIMRICGNTSVT
jgi:hypothetical protein